MGRKMRMGGCWMGVKMGRKHENIIHIALYIALEAPAAFAESSTTHPSTMNSPDTASEPDG